MRYQIVSDSSSNIFHIEGVNYTTVPMKIIAGEKEYVDTESLDVRGMVDDLKAYKGKSGSSCANAQEWLDAFGDADMVFGVTISRNLSGSFNAAEAAAREIFGKSASGLTRHESSLIAACLPNPISRNAGRPSAYVSKRAGQIRNLIPKIEYPEWIDGK